jgi:hypothetical protein
MEPGSHEDREDRAAELLGQIRDSLSEFVRALNEEAARARRIADEAQHKHDVALQQLEKLGRETHTTNLDHGKLLSDIRHRWPKYIKAEAEEIALAQARACSEATVVVIEDRLRTLGGGLEQLMGRIQAVAERAQSVSDSLQWKTFGHAGLIAIGALAVLLPLSMWWGSRSIADTAGKLSRSQSAGYARLRELSKAQFRDCEVGGSRRLCVRIESGLPTTLGSTGEVYAVVHGR